MCAPPSAVTGVLRTSALQVETANGAVTAQGGASVTTPGLGLEVEAVVLPNAPRLLSAGRLVQQGYTLRWGRTGCHLTDPRGVATRTSIIDGIPTLPCRGSYAAAGCISSVADTKTRATPARAVYEKAADEHRQQGHYPWSAECGICNEAALRSDPHHRRMPHPGVLAVDIASLTVSGPHVLVGATQMPGFTYAEAVRSRAAVDLRAPLLRMILEARSRGTVGTVRSGREDGLFALEGDLLSVGARLSSTQGNDPQANGIAEQAVGQLSRTSRAILGHYPEAVAAALWQHAMIWAAQRTADPKLPPFGAKVVVRPPPATKLKKLGNRATPGIFLHNALKTHGACCVGLLKGDNAVHGVAERKTPRAVLKAGGY